MNIIEQEDALEAAGFQREQARAILRAITSGDESAFSKRDGAILETSLRGDMEKMETSLRGDMEKMETSLRGNIDKLDQKIDTSIKEVKLELRLHMWVVAGSLLAAMVALQKLGILT